MIPLEHVLATLPAFQGWCSPDKATKLFNLVTNDKLEKLVELGVFGGSSIWPQAAALENLGKGKIYGVDPWSLHECLLNMGDLHRAWWSTIDMNAVYDLCVQNLMAHNVYHRCELLRMSSAAAVPRFDDNSIDLLHIDGNHSEETSYYDSTAWFPKVKVGGYIVFDDIHWTEGDNFVTTRKAALWLRERCDLVDVAKDADNRPSCFILKKTRAEA